MSRSYRQQCGLARALDVVGERWTLLVLRELTTGPKRFKDLNRALTGAGTNLLSARLRELEASGVIRRRRLPPPAGVDVYELTERGAQLRAPIEGLALWGAPLVDQTDTAATARGAWIALMLRAAARGRAVRADAVPVEFTVDDEVFHFTAEDGDLELTTGQATRPLVRARCGVPAFRALARGERAPGDLIADGRLDVEGDRGALDRFVADVVPGSAG